MNRIKKAIEQIERDRSATEAQRRAAADPWYEAWIPRIERAIEKEWQPLNKAAVEREWDDELCGHLADVLNDYRCHVFAVLGLHGLPRPRSAPDEKLKWYRSFAEWFLMLPDDLKIPALVELKADAGFDICRRHDEAKAVYAKTGQWTLDKRRDSWLTRWLSDLGYGSVSLPSGLTSETLGEVVQAVLDHVADLDYTPRYCDGCGLLRPQRVKRPPWTAPARMFDIWPHCPHCSAKWGWPEPDFTDPKWGYSPARSA